MQLNEILQKLKEIEPSLFDKNGELILEKFKAYLNNEKTPLSKESYTLNWLGKSYAKALVHDKNLTFLAPNTAHNTKDENKNSNNLLIQGDNLAVLKHLRKAYRNSVKMIYIDPPYNTGSDGFVYNDDRKYSATQIAEITGEDEEVAERIFNFINRNASSHSAWLTFMYPRLKVARELLKDDGVIFISIDDNEQAQLKMLCDEVFGEENFRNSIAVKRGAKSVQAQFDNIDKLGIAYEYALLYTKDSNYKLPHFYFDLQEVKKGAWNNHWRGTNRPSMRYEIFGKNPNKGQWRWAKERSLIAIENYKLLLLEKGDNPNQEEIDNWFLKQSEKKDLLRISSHGKPEHYIPPTDKKYGHSLWTDMQINGTSELKRLNLNLFDNPKNSELINRMINWTTFPNDLILDFFAGSGTTAHAVMQLNAEDGGNRNYICVQLDEPADKKSEAHKAGYNTIFEITRERIKRVAAKIKEENPNYKGDLGFKEFKLENYPNGYGVSPENAQQGAEQGKLFSQLDLGKEKLNTILTTWTVNDGLPLTEPPREIMLNDDYLAYLAINRLYLLHKNFNNSHLADLLAKIDNMQNSLNIEKIIAFGHHFDSKALREIEEAVHQYKTRKGVQLYWETRYE